jgi:hypothetical protein
VNRRKLEVLKTTFWISSVSITIFISFNVVPPASVFERIIFMPVILAGVVVSIICAGAALGLILSICELVLKIAEKIEDWLSR